MEAAAQVAAAALLDTLATCRAVFSECHLALAGELTGAYRERELRAELDGWMVHAQRGATLGERLAHAHGAVAGRGPTVQIGMDTPQVSPRDLHAVAVAAGPGTAVLGRAPDGGWWVLALEDATAAAGLAQVSMSTASTYDDTLSTLEVAGQTVVEARSLRDVDTVEDARAVAGEVAGGHFRQAWSEVTR
jgi:glycosyltransferase A (GT-A) superfamily protein (DUF2064 family)